ncbi:MAG TPA: hypothetical protein VJS64_05935, partial [Pyrinomonadaceae bacterium]|nr:hypothetical protein [Pyrinomonadaceae bacterium]
MLKDNEKMQFLDDQPLDPSEPQGFAPDEMVRCETCLRTSPPTRANCLYCAAALPVGKKIIDQRAITLKPLEESVPGYNCIRVTGDHLASQLSAAAQLLQISDAALQRIIDSNSALPLTRTANREEAELLSSKLAELGVGVLVVSDDELGVFDATAIMQTRAVDIAERDITFKQIGGAAGMKIPWSQIQLVVSGRLITRRVESAEQKGKRGEKEVVEASEFFADELVMDIYVNSKQECFRVIATKFDFSSLPQRRLLVAENFAALLDLIRENSAAAQIDDSYFSLRQTLDLVWPAGQHTGSRGWRRERPGKYSTAAVTESSNANQFTRYSRLRWFFNQR